MVPTFFLFKGSEHNKPKVTDFSADAPRDAAYYQNEHAYSNIRMMLKWIEHLRHNTGVGDRCKRILVVMVSARRVKFEEEGGP